MRYSFFYVLFIMVSGCINKPFSSDGSEIVLISINIASVDEIDNSVSISSSISNKGSESVTLTRCGPEDPKVYAIFTGITSESNTVLPLCEAIENTTPLVLGAGDSKSSTVYVNVPVDIKWQTVRACLSAEGEDFCSPPFQRLP